MQGRSQDFCFGGGLKFWLKFEPTIFDAEKTIPPAAGSFNWSNIILKKQKI